MLQHPNLQGMTPCEIDALQHKILMDFFAPETTDADRNDFIRLEKLLNACQPHTFVLADLFDAESMSLDIPDHVYESDPSLEWVTCPCCDGEKWLEVEGNVWTKALFADPRQAYAYRNLNSSFKLCGRCGGVGEVLDAPTPYAEASLGMELPKTPVTPSVDELIARVEYLLAAHYAHQSIMQDIYQGRR